jgi:hypothetical protein
MTVSEHFVETSYELKKLTCHSSGWHEEVVFSNVE